MAGPDVLDLLCAARIDALTPSQPPPDLPGYLGLALTGGFPDSALRLTGPARSAWLDSYLEQLLTRDAATLSSRAPRQLRRNFQALAPSTAGTPQDKTLYDAAGIDRKTALPYDLLLSDLLVTEVLPASLPNRLSRLVKAGERYVVDPSLVGAALRLDVSAGVARVRT